jgi:Tol biopolymer transport system component
VLPRAIAVAALLALGCAGAARAEAPPGPRIAYVLATHRPIAVVIGTSDAALGTPAIVAGGGLRARPLPAGGVAWSPDGSQIAFDGFFAKPGIDLSHAHRRLYLVAADGSGLRPIPHTRGAFAPVFSPGGRIAFARTIRRHLPRLGPPGPSVWKGTSVWTIRPDGSSIHQLTDWRNGVTDVPSSFSADGALLGVSHRDEIRNRDDALAIRVDGGGSRLLAKNAAWPRYSPDGGRIAYLGIERQPGTTCCELGDGFSVDLFVENADGTGRLRLTDTPAKAEQPASWDPSGERLVFTTRESPTLTSAGLLEDAVMEINVDGSCRTKVKSETAGIFQSPAWQPGPGRELGRIAC